jgi:hypothetical protein
MGSIQERILAEVMEMEEYEQCVGRLAIHLGWSYKETNTEFTKYVASHLDSWRGCYAYILECVSRTGKWPGEKNG